MTWIQTRSGARFDLLHPERSEVRIGDVAYALSRIPRFLGHTLRAACDASGVDYPYSPD